MQPRALASERGAPERARAVWWTGFANLLRKEIAAWTGRRTWWVQPGIWLLVLTGPMMLPLALMREVFAAETEGVFAVARQMFFGLGSSAPAIGAVLLMQGSVVTERELGTAAWVLSKPVTRSAMLLAKLVVNATALLLAAFALPGAVAFVLLSRENGAALPLAPFATALGLAAVNVLFYLVLTLALGATVRSRGVVLAVPLAALLAGDLLLGVLGRFGEITPWLVARFVPFVAEGGALPTILPVAATFAWIVVLMVLAVVAFGREDL